FIERVEAIAESVPEDDCPPADGLRDRGVFAFRVAGDVDAASERDRPRVQGLGEGGLAGADNACEDDVGCGDDAAGVEGPGVVHERSAGVEVLPDEYSVGAEAAF